MKTAIVLEGGGLRGAFCAGVMATLDRQLARRPDFVCATSAAGPSAAFLTTGQIDVSIGLWENRTHAGHLISPAHWFKGRPLMDVDKLVDTFRAPRPLAVERFDDAPTQVLIAVTNCRTGQAEFVPMRSDNAFKLLTATMALPIAYGKVVQVYEQFYIDGGLTASIPLEPVLDRDVEHILVVLTRPRGYAKIQSRSAELIARLSYPQYPELWRVFAHRAQVYNNSIEQVEALEAAGRISVIRPEAPLPASRMTRDRRRIMDTIQVGRNSAKEWLRTRTLG